MRTIFPIILLVGAALLFFGVTQPIYERAKSLRADNQLYTEVLSKMKELQRIRDAVLSQLNSIPQEGIDRLAKMIPDTVDNVRFVRDLDTLARRHTLSLSDISVQVTSADEVTASGYGILTVTFRTRGTYEVFNAFLRDIEQSLRLMDVTRLAVTVSDRGTTEYGVTVETYWLKK